MSAKVCCYSDWLKCLGQFREKGDEWAGADSIVMRQEAHGFEGKSENDPAAKFGLLH